MSKNFQIGGNDGGGCQHRKDLPRSSVADDGRRIRPGRIPSVRLKRFLTLLENALRCEVKDAKGSEITVYRRGGKKAILSGHRRNRIIPTIEVKRTLRRLGISDREWLSAAGEIEHAS